MSKTTTNNINHIIIIIIVGGTTAIVIITITNDVDDSLVWVDFLIRKITALDNLRSRSHVFYLFINVLNSTSRNISSSDILWAERQKTIILRRWRKANNIDAADVILLLYVYFRIKIHNIMVLWHFAKIV